MSLPNGTMKISSVNVIDKLSNQTIYVDLDKLKFPLTVRKKREGDVFYPIGMKGKKKWKKQK